MEWAVLLDGLWGFIASVTAVTAVLLSVRKLRRENTSQHDSNADLLRHVADQVNEVGHAVGGVQERLVEVDQRLTSHIEWEYRQKYPQDGTFSS